MQRAPVGDHENPAGRVRSDEASVITGADPFRPELQRNASDILEHGNDGSGFIGGRVHMRWLWTGSTPKYKMIFESENTAHTGFDKIHIIFSGICADFRDLVAFDIGDRIYISLRGARAERLEKSGATVPLLLTYNEGVAFRYVVRKNKSSNDGAVVDTWRLQEEMLAQDQKPRDPDDWYSTPAPPDPFPDMKIPGASVPAGRGIDHMDVKGQRTPRAMSNTTGPSGPNHPLAAQTAPGFYDEIPKPSRPSDLAEPSNPVVNDTKAGGDGRIDSMHSIHGPIKIQSARPTLDDDNAQQETDPQPTRHRQAITQLPRNHSSSSTTSSVPSKRSISSHGGPTDALKKSASRTSSREPAVNRSNPAPRPAVVPPPAPTPGGSSSRSSLPQNYAHPYPPNVPIRTPDVPAQLTVQPSPNSAKATKKKPNKKQRKLMKANKLLEEAAAALAPSPAQGTAMNVDADTSAVSLMPEMSAPVEVITHQIQPEIKSAPPVAGPSRLYVAVDAADSPPGRSKDDSPAIVHQVKQTSRYPTLTTLSSMVQKRVDLIGVVACVNDVKAVKSGGAATDKWSKVLRLVDPTNFDARDAGSLERGTAGFAVTCFAREYVQWLPNVKQGNIILLKEILVETFHNNARGTGFSDRLQHAVFDPESRTFADGGAHLPDGVPRQEFLGANQDGHACTPFWRPDAADGGAEDEVVRCAPLGLWWEGVIKEIEKARGAVHQVGTVADVSMVGEERRGPRKHRLVKEANPSMWPQGYFDCTVEVIFGRDNGAGQPFSLYVTDYTKLEGGAEIKEPWCPEELGRHILRVEMWDSSRSIGEGAQSGDLLALNNARMVVDRSGHVVAKCQEGKKIQKLAEADVGAIPTLAALLKRKKDWQETGEKPWPHLLVQDINEESRYFQLTVEVLNVQSRNHEAPVVFVTDYTSNASLPPLPDGLANARWAFNLSGRILQVALRGDQEKFVKMLQPPGCFRFKSLHMTRKPLMNNIWAAECGGAQLLIQRMSERKPAEELAAMQRRKLEWQNAVSGRSPSPIPGDKQGPDVKPETSSKGRNSTMSAPAPRLTKPLRRRFITVKEAEDMNCPSKFRLRARVVDFWPLKLADCAVERCVNCDRILDTKWKLCPDCMEMDEAYTRPIFHFFLRVADDEGSAMDLFVSSDQKCSLLDGLDPNLIDDEAAVYAFRKRMGPVIGNLEEVHEKLGDVDCPELGETPLLDLVVQCWAHEDGTSDRPRVYELADLAVFAEQ